MSQKYKEKGGGSATGLANDFIGWLRSGLDTGTFGGTSGVQQTNAAPYNMGGMGGVLNDILSGGAGRIGGSYRDMIDTDTTRQVDALRSRFGVGGGMGSGTPAAYGEALLRSEQAPKLVQAIGGLQLSAMNPLLQILAGLSGKGIAQRQGIMSPNPWVSGLSTIAQGITAGKGMFGGGDPSGGGGTPQNMGVDTSGLGNIISNGVNPGMMQSPVFDLSAFMV